MRRRRGITPLGSPGTTGGTAFEPGVRPSPKPQAALEAPPYLSYDPAIEAQRREAARGLADTEADTTTKQHFAHQDLTSALRDLHIKATRGRQDINRSANRTQRKLGYQESDTQRTAGRREQDFNTSLQNIARQFGQLGHRQAEAANASGVLDQGTLAASGAARAGNQALAEAPIHTAQERGREDLSTALSRIGTARGEAAADQSRSIQRLGADTRHERAEAQRSTGRKDFESTREEERARREYQFKNVDLLAQEIYAARAEHPHVFKQWLKEHPEAMAAAKNRAEGNKKPQKKGGR